MLPIKQNEDLLLNEVELARELNTTKHSLDALRLEKGFPFYRVTTRDRVYRLNEVVAWLERNGKAS